MLFAVSNKMGIPDDQPSLHWEEDDWEALLGHIAGRHVIPVLGRDLLCLEVDGQPITLNQYLARCLAAKIGIPETDLPATPDVNDVISRYLNGSGRRLDRLYQYVYQILHDPPMLPIPRPLQQLAEISDFPLYVSTTVDPLLENALNTVRFGGDRQTATFAFQPKKKVGLPQPFEAMDGPAVYYLLGQAVPERGAPTPGSFVLSEEDLVEFLYALRPDNANDGLDRLFQALKENYLLMLGGGFSDWVTRFFLRIAKYGRLFNDDGPGEFLAENHENDSNLVLFLRLFRQQSKVYSRSRDAGTCLDPVQTPVEFVDELWRRWTAQNRPVVPVPQIAATRSMPSAFMPKGAVFISYAREDLPAVQRIKAGLDAAGVQAWFDMEQLKPAQIWENSIRENIERCSYFLPVVSRQTEAKYEGYFRTEWRMAAERFTRFYGSSEEFLIPVSVDDTRESTAVGVDRSFKAVQWTSLPGGEVTHAFIERVRGLVAKRLPPGPAT